MTALDRKESGTLTLTQKFLFKFNINKKSNPNFFQHQIMLRKYLKFWLKKTLKISTKQSFLFSLQKNIVFQ